MGTDNQLNYSETKDRELYLLKHSYSQMKQRCYNPNSKFYKNYGGRGIKICDRWLESFDNFLQDMGRKPTPDLQLDRIDNDGNYEPSNCRWATREQQAQNKRNTAEFYKKYNKKK